MSSVAFRLTIYQSNGTTPDLTMTSIRSGTNPYIVGVPSGDGQEVDLLTGAVRSGAYNIEVADVVTGSDGTGTVRLVTNKLEDASFRQQLLSRRAKLEMSRNNGSTWSVWIFGYLTGLRQVDAITYSFTVSDSRRIEASHTAFTWSADPNAATDEQREFPNRGCLVGGPTLQSFGPIKATGGWEYAWQEVQGRIVALNFIAAYNPPSWARNSTIDVLPYFNAIRPFFQMLPPIANLTGANFQQIRERQFVYGSASVQAIITAGSSVWKGTVRGAHTPPSPSQNGQGPSTVPNFGNMNFMYIDLDPGQSTSYPSANTFVRVQLIQKKVSEVSPLYISEHPVDIVTKLYETVNIPFNASSAATVKALIGDDLRLALRITEPVVLGQFLAQSIFGPFGFSARTNASGEQEFFTTRIARATTPTISITDDDIVGDTPPPIFELEESSVVTSFRLTTKTLTPYISDLTEGLQAPPDGITETETTEVVQNADTSTYSTREVAYRFPGMLYNGSASSTAFTLSPEVVGSFFTGILAEGFDRFGRGAIASEVQVLATSSAASLQVGDEVLIDVGYYPNKNYRIGESSVGSRIAQIVRRTEAPEGPIFKLIDSGVNAQPTSPTFTLAKDAGDPRRVAAVTVTNASTLNAAGVTLAVQYQVSATTPTKTGTLYTRFLPGTIPTVAFNLPAVLPGSRVWVRMRTERTEYRASAWTAWTDVALDAWVAPASLTVGTTTANSIALSWSLGSPTANTIDPLDVFAYAGASAPADWTNYRVGSLANGSTSITVRNLDPSTQYTFGVAFKDEGSGAYSSFATATATTNAVNTVSCPAAPKMKVYTSFPDAGTSTGVALAIGAVEGYNIVVQRAPDSSGSPGTWADIALLAPLTPIFVDPLPSDGATRWYRVFYRLSGFLDGTPGTARSATPIAIPDELVGQNASIISGGATLTFGNYLVGTPDSFYDGATSQSVAVDATPNATANKVVARDGSGNFAANTVTATLNGPAPAGQLTGDTLAANVVTSSLTTVGTIGTGTWQGTSVGKNYGGTGLTSSAFSGITNERVFAYDGASGAFFVAPSGSNGQALVYTAGALAWGNPAPGPHVLASTTGLGAEHTVSGLTSGMILQATGATTARFQTPSIPASSVTAGSFGGAAYTFTNDLTVSGTLTASLPYSSITGKPSYFPADLTSVNGTLGTANGGTANASWPAANSGEYVVIYDSVTGAERLEAGPQGSNGQALIVSGGALTWGNPAPGPHVLATTTGLGTDHTVSGLTSGMILQATGATTARFQTPSIPASSVTAGTFSGTSYTITNDLTVSGTLTASLTGNASTATALQTARNINGVSFNGTADITVTAAAGTLTGNTLASGVTASSLTSVGTLVNLTVTNAIVGSVTGNAGTVTDGVYTTGTYANPSWITSLAGSKISGNISGSAANVTGTVAIANGGTNATSYGTSGTGTRAIVYDIGSNAFEAVAAGSSGQFLQSAGTTGDITWATPPTFTSSAAGYAPASGGGTSNFLRADGTWAVPSVGSVSANNVTAGTFSGATYTFSNSVTFTSGVRVANGETYKILNSGGTAIDVLSATTLGSGVINSSLTSVGTLTGLSVGGTASVTGTMTANRYAGVNSLTLNTYTTVNPSSNVYLYSPPNDRDAWVYLDSADTGSNWGIYHRQIDSTVSGLPANSIGFVGGGSSGLQAWISLANGNANFAGALTQAGNQVLHAGNVSSYALPISGGTVTGTLFTTPSGVAMQNLADGIIGFGDATHSAGWGVSQAIVARTGDAIWAFGSNGGTGNNDSLFLGIGSAANTTFSTAVSFTQNRFATFYNGLNVSGGALQQGGNQVLHAGNFGSYAMAGAGFSANQNLNTTSSPQFRDLTIRNIFASPSQYLEFNKPSLSGYQTVALFGTTANGLYLTTDSALITRGAYFNTGWIATSTSGTMIDMQASSPAIQTFSGATIGGSPSWSASQTIVHAGNVGSYAIPASGGTVTGTLSLTSAYVGGSGDFTNMTNAPLTINPTSGYWRLLHLSQNSTISGVYNYQTGKNVYWGEPNDTGNYYFRGRALYWSNASADNLVLHAGNFSSYALPLSGGTLSGKIGWGTSLPNAKRIIGIYESGNFFSGIGMDSANAGVRIAGDPALTLLDVGSYSTDGNYTWTSRFFVSPSAASFNGNTMVHAGNVGSYALPIGGGTMTGAITTPAGTAIYLGGQNISQTSRVIINWHSDGDYNYLIGKRAGAWTQPMDIAFYTGIRYHAHRDYNGHIFYTTGYDGTESFSIGKGDSNVRVNNSLGVGVTSISTYAQLHVGTDKKLLVTSTSGSWGQLQVANTSDGECTQAFAAGGSGSPGNDTTYTRQWIWGINPYGVGQDTFALTNKTLTSSAPFSVKEGGDVLINGSGWAGSRLQVNESSGPTAEINGTSNTASQSPLYVWNNVESGSTYFISFYSDGQNNARTLRGYINYRRDNATLNLTTASDYRIKTVHGPYTKSGAIFDKLKVHEGTIHGETARVPMVLAHELQEAYEPAVEGEKDAVNEDGTPKLQMVSYVAMIPVMLAEIKSLRERVAQLETQTQR